MKILFLTISRVDDINARGIYSDLMRSFIRHGSDVYIASPTERRFAKPTHLVEFPNCKILRIRTLNIQKTNIAEKGIGTLLLESQFDKAIRKYWGGIRFDLVLYSTPPITFNRVIERVKKRCGCKSYLLLKDIFPQNAVDLGMFSDKGLLYRFFRRKEQKLYALSDHIGCMSPANVNYVVTHNPEVAPSKVEMAPNSLELLDSVPSVDKTAVLKKYHLPLDRPIFIYGGNLGKPQGIPFLIKCLGANANRSDCHFVIIGNGTEMPKIKLWYESVKPVSVTLMERLPKEDYDRLVAACDVGLIFLDNRFTIPNYPSRLLSYLENKMPIIAATDVNCDTGSIAEENGYGYWCRSDSVEGFTAAVNRMLASDRKEMGEKGYGFLCANYLVQNTYNAIVKHFS